MPLGAFVATEDDGSQWVSLANYQDLLKRLETIKGIADVWSKRTREDYSTQAGVSDAFFTISIKSEIGAVLEYQSDICPHCGELNKLQCGCNRVK